MTAKKYTSLEFADLLGISKSSLLDKERKGILPKPEREIRGQVSYRYYTEEDIPRFRDILNSPQPIYRRRIQLFLNCQNGTGKSSIAANYIKYASSLGINTLAIDLDQKGDLSTFLMGSQSRLYSTIGQVLLADGAISGAMIKVNKYLSVVPGNIMLAPASIELNSRRASEFLLISTLRRIYEQFNLIVIDVNSHPDILMKNAIVASDDIVIPITDEDHVASIRITFDLVKQIEGEYSGLEKKRIHIFRNMVDKKSNGSLASGNINKMLFGRYLTDSSVRFDGRFEAASKQFDMVMTKYPRSRVTKDIKKLADEIVLASAGSYRA